jgi:hypothetical protein
VTRLCLQDIGSDYFDLISELNVEVVEFASRSLMDGEQSLIQADQHSMILRRVHGHSEFEMTIMDSNPRSAETMPSIALPTNDHMGQLVKTHEAEGSSPRRHKVVKQGDT